MILWIIILWDHQVTEQICIIIFVKLYFTKMHKLLKFGFTTAKNITSSVKYVGDLRCQATHLQSGSKIQSDAPTDNQGKGQKFSPTDLCAVSLAQCALTTIAIRGKPKNINIDNAVCELQKIMQTNPRKISQIVCNFKFDKEYSEDQRKFIEDTAHDCPVAHTLHPDLKQTMTFTYGNNTGNGNNSGNGKK